MRTDAVSKAASPSFLYNDMPLNARDVLEIFHFNLLNLSQSRVVLLLSAQLLSIMATNSLSRLGMSCIKCNVFQPHDGKILSCMHLICAGCCREEIAQDSNTIKCLSCSAITKAMVRGVGIVDQLMSSEPHLYKASEVAAPQDAAGELAEGLKLVCELCDEDEESVATHECEKCCAALLCKKHAERHSRTRMFIGHVVTKLNSEQRSDGQRRLVTRFTRCLVHKHNEVSTFCRTCSHSICSHCLATGHHGHTVATPSSVAAERLSAVRAAIRSTSNEYLHSASSSPMSMEPPLIQDMLTDVSGEMDEMRQEAEAASGVLTGTFDQVDAIIQKKRQQLLRQIYTIHWKQLEARESKQQRLYGIEECYGTVTQLVKCMTGGDMDDEDVIHFSAVALSILTKMYSDLDSEKTPLQRRKIGAISIAEALCELEKQVQSLVLVEEVPPIDVTNIIATLPDIVNPGRESAIRLTFPGVTTTARPSLAAKICLPSGGSHAANICELPDSSSTSLVVSVTFTTREVGWHALEVSDSACKRKSTPIPFECQLPAPFALDHRKCSRHITISGKNDVAVYTGNGSAWASVAANQGYTTGHHTWKIKLRSTEPEWTLLFGVCALPGHDNYDSTMEFFGTQAHYFWADFDLHDFIYCSTGHKFRNGDTATLTLDCEQKTLEAHHHRTDERRIIPTVNCDKALYPAFCMKCLGQQAEIQ